MAKWVFKNHRPYDLYMVKEEEKDTFNDIKPLKNIRRLVEKEAAGTNKTQIMLTSLIIYEGLTLSSYTQKPQN